MGVQFEVKYWLKYMAFNLNFLSNLLPMCNVGIRGIFLLLKNVLRTDQYVLELVEGSINLLANLS